MEKLYRYYTPMRPPMLGAIPKQGLQDVHVCDRRELVAGCQRPVWGWADYDRKLTAQELFDYEMVAG